MNTQTNHFRLPQHAPLLLTLAMWVLSFGWLMYFGDFHQEVLHGVSRLIVSLSTVALLSVQWVLYRRNTGGLHLAFLTAVLFVLSLPAVWLALNVVRSYTYNDAVEHTETIAASIHFVVIRVQDGLIWSELAVFVVAVLLGISDAFRSIRHKPAR